MISIATEGDKASMEYSFRLDCSPVALVTALFYANKPTCCNSRRPSCPFGSWEHISNVEPPSWMVNYLGVFINGVQTFTRRVFMIRPGEKCRLRSSAPLTILQGIHHAAPAITALQLSARPAPPLCERSSPRLLAHSCEVPGSRAPPRPTQV